ncbi:hypothetical protein [Carboxylicivirga taeanensis]|uniref:hypothetical protein n=1 Tax=Carboxylicivirga taeanensis TaxID=1416875 RepID=UPI003F6DF714
MHYTKNSISSFQSGVELLFYNSLHQQSIKSAIERYGYREGDLIRIYNLNKELADAINASEVAKGRKREVFREKNQLFANIKREYMRYLKLARIALSDDIKAAEALMLNGARERTYKALLFQINAFISNLINNVEWLDAITVFNITRDALYELRRQVKELNHLSDRCLEAQGEVRRLTELKKRKLVDVQRHVSDYVKIVRIAFEDHPEALVSLGIKKKNEQ